MSCGRLEVSHSVSAAFIGSLSVMISRRSRPLSIATGRAAAGRFEITGEPSVGTDDGLLVLSSIAANPSPSLFKTLPWRVSRASYAAMKRLLSHDGVAWHLLAASSRSVLAPVVAL